MRVLRRFALAGLALALFAGASTAALADHGWHGGHGDWHGHGTWHGHGNWHHGGHANFGFYFGAPLDWGPWGYPPYSPYSPYYSYPPQTIIVPVSPPVYVQKSDAGAAHWWYYCADSKAYYPYVKQCPGGWQRVAPQPSSG